MIARRLYKFLLLLRLATQTNAVQLLSTDFHRILKGWQGSIVHIFGTNNILDYSKLPSPVLSDTYEHHERRRFNATDKLASWPRLRHTRGFLSMVEANTSEALTISRMYNQKNILNLRTNSWHSVCAKVFPKAVVIVTPEVAEEPLTRIPWLENASLTSPLLYSAKEFYCELSYQWSLRHLPPIYILPYKTGDSSPEPIQEIDTVKMSTVDILRIDHAFFVCWYCGATEMIRTECNTSNCLDGINKVREAATGKGANILWAYNRVKAKDDKFWTTSRHFCPETKTAKNCDYQLLSDTVPRFLLGGLNRSAYSEKHMCESNELALPQIRTAFHTKRAEDRDQAENFYMPLSSDEFKFITSDSVTPSMSSYEIYVKPFHWTSWCALACTALILLLAVCTSSYIFEKGRGNAAAGATSWYVLWLAGSFLEQTDAILTPGIRSRRAVRFCIVLSSCWLLASVILSNAYRGIIRSKFFLPNSYVMPWKSLRELENFTLYIPAHGEMACKMIQRTQDWGRLSFWQEDDGWEEFGWKQQACNNILANLPAASREVPGCAIFSEVNYLVDILDENNGVKCYMRKFSQGKRRCFPDLRSINISIVRPYALFLDRLRRNLQHICFDQLEMAINLELGKLKTAVVVPRRDFDKTWAKFDPKIRKQSRTKFASNINTDDQAFRLREGFYISSGFDPKLRNIPMERMEAFIVSGIAGAWQRWSVFSRERNDSVEAARLQQKYEKVVISFDNSDVDLIFFLFGYASALATLAFGVELLIRFKNQRKWFRRS